MRVKTKLTLGVGLLFIFIILLAGIGTFYIHELNTDTQNILVANYNTLDYSRNMLGAMDENITKPESISKFLENLERQQNNITEPGEKELTDQLAADFRKLRNHPKDSLIYINIRKDLTDIMLLNMQAIARKSNKAKLTANSAIWWIALTGTICFLMAFILLINLPGNIANPIKELTKSIKEIANKNYDQRLHFQSSDEFGDLAASFNTMAAKLEEYENSNLSKLLFEKKRIETLINNMSDPIIGLDENKRVLFANEEALKILNIEHKNLIGKHMLDISLKNDLMRSLTQDLMLSKQEREKKSHKQLKIFANGRESYFEQDILDIYTTPTGEKSNKLIGHVILLNNVTPFKELDMAKTNFIATVSHELKTPISSMQLSLKLLEDPRIGALNKEQKQLVKNVAEDSERLLKITGELLKMTQVETGKIQLSIQPSDVKEIIRYAVEANKVQAELSKIDIKVIIPDHIPKVNADSEKTAWVLTNLISNAIRYSHENSKVIVSANYEDKHVILAVEDYGRGIDSKYKDKVFDRYFRIPGTTKEGTGLGLAISREFIEAQGGSISCKSQLGSGSTFTVTLNRSL